MMKKDNQPSSKDKSQQATSFVVFGKFGSQKWSEWVRAFVSGTPISPAVAVTNEEPHQILIDLFDNLNSKSREQFRRAVFLVFETTPITKRNERELFYLLHLLAYTIPPEAKSLLRRRLREGLFRRLEFGRQNLHSLLLLACSKYHVDEALRRYVERSARATPNYDYRLLCQWVLSAVEGSCAYDFMEQLLPLMNSAEDAAALTRQLTTISERLGYRYFLTWYQSKSATLYDRWSEQWKLFNEALRIRLLSDQALPALARADRDSVLLYAEVRTVQDVLGLDTVLTIAKLHKYLDVEDTVGILTDIWKSLYERTGEIPWEYFPASEKRGASQEFVGTIQRYRDEKFEECHVETASEPDTEKVLIETANRCGALVIPTARVAGGYG